MKKLNYSNLLLIFVFSSIFGWLVEGAWSLLRYGNLINHSAVVIGPFDMAYGICACVLTLVLFRFKDSSIFKLFAIGFIGGSILEYIMSFGMELILGFTAWDYSNKFLNINGRICLMYSIFWGILAIVWIKFCYPFIDKLIDKIKPKIKNIIAICLSIFLVFDILLTFAAVNRAHDYEKGITPHNKFETMLDKTFNVKYLRNMYNNNWE